MDSLEENPGYVDSAYLRATAAHAEAAKRRSYALLRLAPGLRVLELGCGPATDTIALAQLVGPTGRVVGVDHDPEMVLAARARARAAGVERWTEHIEADALALPFAAGAFERVRAERVFQHLARPREALAELVRVTAPGGIVGVGEPDWGTLSMECRHVDIERRLARFNADVFSRNGYVGRSLYGLFVDAGLEEPSVELFAVPFTSYAFARYVLDADRVEAAALAAGALTADEVARLRAECERADAAGAFFGSLTGVWVSGRKPAPATPGP